MSRETASSCVVLGAGMVGSLIAADLATDPELAVTAVDRDGEALGRLAARAPAVQTRVADLADAAVVKEVVEGADVVVGALASAIGLQTLGAVIEAGRDYCDISFMPQDALALDAAARARGVTAVVDCGVAPGMSHVLAARGCELLDRAERIEIYVGGLPAVRSWPYEYKAGFAPRDVIAEYTRPARLIEHGQLVVREALTEPELIEFDELGTLEACNTDGLRTLLFTVDVPFRVEKTLRYPGHYELMRVLRHTGLFDEQPVSVGPQGVSVRPIDVTAALLFPRWTYQPGEADLTVMRVIVSGEKGGRRTSLRWDLFDRYDPETGWTSMARTTGFPAAIVARMLLRGTFKRPGVHPPEVLGRDPALLDDLLAQQRARGVRFVETTIIDHTA